MATTTTTTDKKLPLPANPSLTPPKATAYTAPNTALKTVDAVTKPSDSYITDNSLVQNQMKTAMDPNSPLMQMAKTRALQQAEASGNQNTSMANQAVTAGMADTAFNIAKQDASTYGAAALNKQQTENSGALGTQLAGYDNQTQRNLALINGALNNQNFYNANAASKYANELGKDTTAFNYPYNWNLAQQGYDSALNQTSVTTAAALSQQLAASLASILNNKDVGDKISARESLISAMQTALTW
jgi:hypothetical protein